MHEQGRKYCKQATKQWVLGSFSGVQKAQMLPNYPDFTAHGPFATRM
jgi:hypothetical protein